MRVTVPGERVDHDGGVNFVLFVLQLFVREPNNRVTESMKPSPIDPAGGIRMGLFRSEQSTIWERWIASGTFPGGSVTAGLRLVGELGAEALANLGQYYILVCGYFSYSRTCW